jgi:putative MFS transporter
MFLNFASTVNWNALTTLVGEMYPTVLRATGAGFCTTLGRISAAALPIAVGTILEVSMLWGLIVLSVTCLIGALAAIFAVETVNRKLADDV